MCEYFLQPVELQDLTGLTVYDVNHFEQEVLQQVTNDVLDSKTVSNTGEVPAMTLGVLGIEETEYERKIRTGEMTPFGSTDVPQKKSKRYIIVAMQIIGVPVNFEISLKMYLDLTTFSSEDMLEKYLISQSKLSTMIHKSKIKTSSTKKELIDKSKESGSEYFPTTDSGN